MPKDVFLSYARDEAHLAQPVYRALVSLGLDVFFDTEDIEAGSRFPQRIRDGLQTCKVLLAMWTPLYHRREWCLRECSFADSDEKLLPVAVAPLAKRDLDPEFIRVSWLPLSDFGGAPDHPEWLAVVKALAARLDRWADAHPDDSEAAVARSKALRLRAGPAARTSLPAVAPMETYLHAVENELDSTPWALQAPIPDAARTVGELFVQVTVGTESPRPLADVHRETPAGRFMLLGDPGAGKTMALKHHGLWCLREGRLTPIFVRAAELRPTLRETLLADPASAPVADVLLERAAAGGVALLIDSIDEVDQADEKARVRKQLMLLAKDPVWTRCPIFAASRSVGYTEVPGFQALAVQPLAEDAMVDLLTRWEVAPERIEEVRLERRAGGRLRSMSENPLLVTLMAIVLRRRAEEPRQWSRTGLYREAIEVLLTGAHRRELEGSAGYRHGDLALQVLSAHALAAHGTERRDVFTARALAAGAAPWVGAMRAAAADGRLEGFLADLARHTGLIETRGGGTFGFPHRTFAEYLAATELARRWAAGEGEAELERVLATATWDDATKDAAWKVFFEDMRAKGYRFREGVTARNFNENGLESYRQWPEAAGYKLRPEHESTTAEVLALTHGVLVADGHTEAARTFLAAVLGRSLDPHLLSRVGRALDQLDRASTHQLLDAMPGAAHWEQRRSMLFELPTLLARPAEVLRFLQERAERVTHGADLYWLHRLAVWFGAGLWGPPAREVQARAAEWAVAFWAAHRPDDRRRVVGELRWVQLPAGTFQMGSPDGVGDPVEHPQHAVEVVVDLEMLDAPVTNARYELFDPDHRTDRRPRWTERPDEHPVYNVTWYEAAAFAQWLDAADTAVRVRLPFEVEWEYATRLALRELPEAETGVLAWYEGNADSRVHAVRQKPDPAGRVPGGPPLWDLLGNVWQWCADRWDARRYARKAGPPPYRHDPRSAQVDHPTADPATHGAWRVSRGGSWNDPAGRVRVAYRNGDIPGDRNNGQGFRLVRVLAPPAEALGRRP